MTIVHGQIESLKSIRATLNRNGIDRFNSLGEINLFIENYESERKQIIDQAASDLENEIATLEARKIQLAENYEEVTVIETERLKNEIAAIEGKYNLVDSKVRNAIGRLFHLFRLKILKSRKEWMERNFDRIVFNRTFKVFKELQDVGKRLGEYTTNRDTLVNYRSLPKTRELARTKEIVDSLYPQIAGAVGENLVVNELKKLPDKYVLFNDFTLEFDPPIYNRKEDDRIFSIQVDHLLVTNSGIFVIETKNWSKKSVDSYNLRSPVEQIKRTSYALFVILNSRSNQLGNHLKWHHWGDKQLPIRNLVVMIDNKPNKKFKFVQVKTLKELNGYITYFDPIFDDSEVQGICRFLEESQSIGKTANNH